MNTRALPILLTVHAALVAIASFMTWVSVFLLSLSGMDGDGKWTLVLALAAVAATWIAFSTGHGWLHLIAIGALTGAGIIGIYDWARINDAVNDFNSSSTLFSGSARVGAGLVLVTIAGCTPFLTVGALAWWRQRTPAVAT